MNGVGIRKGPGETPSPAGGTPHPEAGEFVNIGVALHSPETGFFDFKLLDAKRTSRVNGFFPELQKEHYRDALKYCGQELERMRGEVGIAGKTAQQTTR